MTQKEFKIIFRQFLKDTYIQQKFFVDKFGINGSVLSKWLRGAIDDIYDDQYKAISAWVLKYKKMMSI